MSQVVAVIMAGGKGERFWPFSRRDQPKQMLPLTTDKPLLVETVNRVLPITDFDHIFIVSNERLAPNVLQSLPDLPPQNSLAEPFGRDTAPCLAFSAHVIQQRFGADTIMLVLSADHHVEHQERFRSYLRQAICVAEADLLCTIGLEPDRPEIGYGYLELGEPVAQLGSDVYRVVRFTEKPDEPTAQKMLDSGNYLWNGGMFCWKTGVFLNAMKR
ncbi:MAG TPA: mannose-1-phosphate guanylyltransferase, partial [bacterium]|nr:mannose-1-phosphate guanylyltransferase [bacterium]